MLFTHPDFISAERCEELIRAFYEIASMPGLVDDRVVKTAHRTEIAGQLLKQANQGTLATWFSKARQQAFNSVREFYHVLDACYIDYTLVTEMRAGDAHPLHADSERQEPEGDWVPNHTSWRVYTAMLYLNTCGVDYQGGVLRFPKIGREVVPRAGYLVGFTCGHQHQHEVTRVQRGRRYAISIWMTHDSWFAEPWD